MNLTSQAVTLLLILTTSSFIKGQNVIRLISGEELHFKKMDLHKNRTSVEIVFTNESKHYNAEEINHIQINDDEKYVSKNIEVNKITRSYLLRNIEEGRVNLLAYKDQIFFIESINKPLEKLFFTRKNSKNSSIDTLHRFEEIPGKYYIRNHYQTTIQDHIGPSYTVSNNLKLKEASIKKIIQLVNKRFPEDPYQSFFNPLVSKRLYVGVVGIHTDEKLALGSHISYEIGINYKGMLSTGYINFLILSDNSSLDQSDAILLLHQRISFGIRQYFFKSSPLKPFIDFGIHSGLPVINAGVLFQHNKFLVNSSINLKAGLFTDSPANLKSIYQINLGFQF